MTLHVLLAHGAGAPSASPWMRRFADLLGAVGPVRTFDYPYMRAGERRRAPDRLEVLVASHRQELERMLAEAAAGDRAVLAGKSMGGRIGCHVAVERAQAHQPGPAGLICFGYPLRSQSGQWRDGVLLALQTPVLFVQGTRDTLCPLSNLEQVRERMKVRNELFVVEGGDHSLAVDKKTLKARELTQEQVEARIIEAVRVFCASL